MDGGHASHAGGHLVDQDGHSQTGHEAQDGRVVGLHVLGQEAQQHEDRQGGHQRGKEDIPHDWGINLGPRGHGTSDKKKGGKEKERLGMIE